MLEFFSLPYPLMPISDFTMEFDNLAKNRTALANALRRRNLIPVIGPEALLVDLPGDDGTPRRVSYYQVVAEKLLETYGLDTSSLAAPHIGSVWPLHRASAEILEKCGVQPYQIREELSRLIPELSERLQPSLAPFLAGLAGIAEFDLMIVLTPDDLLVHLLDGQNLRIGAYSPSGASATQVDVPPASAGMKRLFFPLGRCADEGGFAIHEEDALEYLHILNKEGQQRASIALSELRRRDMLFIGCAFPDWLGRGFLRLANENRLSSSEKPMEFFCAQAGDPALGAFLTRFSPNSRVFPWQAEKLIDELCALSAAPSEAAGKPLVIPPAAPGPTVFVSYADEDQNAARSIAEMLCKLGFSDVWFDKKKLIAGDDWSNRIDEAIAQCDFFMPILSGNADRRREGVFWEEWRKAAKRADRINDAFLLAVGIDAKHPSEMGYQGIFNGFVPGLARIHSLHASNGTLGEAEQEQLRERCRRFREKWHG